MSTDMHDPLVVDTRSAVRLRVDRWAVLWRAAGLESDVAIAAELDMTARQLRRAKAGSVVGSKLMAGAVAALARHADRLAEHGMAVPTLDDLFEVAAPERSHG